MSKTSVSISPYSFPGLRLSQREKESFKNSQRSLRFRITKDEILQIIAYECSVSVADIVDNTSK